ncbi:hypothetical protein [Leifsonia xyli]|uniref:hypothetical protein n=1 Tax=Leifsonia xyli TaxID=1575 RepID=UPI00041015A6|nr:hypothetical protein [Leifsonia xyli]
MRRRGIVKAAAWATPAIIVSTAVPAVASSTRAALAFGDSAYIVSACGRLQNVTVHVTTDGAARSGVSVTVTLPSGFTFSGGATSFTAGTNAAGVIVVPEIAVPATPGEVTIQAAATALGLMASVKLTVQPGGGNAYVAVRDGSSSIASVVGVPAGSTPVWGRWFLTPDAHVVDGLSGTVVLSDVAAVSSGFL